MKPKAKKAAVVVQDDPAYQGCVKELLPQGATVETALATQETVSAEITLTQETFPQLLANGMTDPLQMKVHELAPIVIAGFGKIRQYIPYIKRFFELCESLPRDSKNRWLDPVEGCYSVKEFIVNKLNRAPTTVYALVRQVDATEKAEAKLLTGTVETPEEAEARGNKEAKDRAAKARKTAETKKALETENKKLKARVRIAEAVAGPESYRSATPPPDPSSNGAVYEAATHAAHDISQPQPQARVTDRERQELIELRIAVSLAKTYSLGICVCVNSSGTLNALDKTQAKKILSIARKSAVEFNKLTGVTYEGAEIDGVLRRMSPAVETPINMTADASGVYTAEAEVAAEAVTA